jgi:hypothetical protein
MFNINYRENREEATNMKKLSYFLLVITVISFSACTLYIPYGYDTFDYGPLHIVFQVEPEDAHILLNGRFIGEAYEFSSSDSALTLDSRKNELVVKKEGYVEEAIDLYSYTTRKITIPLKMKREAGYEEEREVKAKTVMEKVPPKEAGEESEPGQIEAADVTLEISPPEAAIYLNGKFWGISPKSGKIENLKLKPGTYHIEVTKPGYKTAKQEVVIKDQKELTLTIQLEK